MTTLPEMTIVAKGATVPRLGYRLDEVAAMVGVDRRTIERLRAAGQFPRPDRTVGKIPLWRLATVERWFGEGGGA